VAMEELRTARAQAADTAPRARQRLALSLLLVPCTAHALKPCCASTSGLRRAVPPLPPRLGRLPCEATPVQIVMCATDQPQNCSAAPASEEGAESIIGAALAELVTRQTRALPGSQRRGLDQANLDAMTDSASRELASAFEELSTNLSSVERVVAAGLSAELRRAGDDAVVRMENATRRIRSDTIEPGRRRVQASLAELREAEAELERVEAAALDSQLGRLGKDPWWQEKLEVGGLYASALERAAQILGLLLFVASIDVAASAVQMLPFDTELHARLAEVWRLAFFGAFVAYFGSLLALTQASRDS